MVNIFGQRMTQHVGVMCWPGRQRLLPKTGEVVIHIETAGGWLVVQWRRHDGYWLRKVGKAGVPIDRPLHVYPRPKVPKMKRRERAAAGLPLVPALSNESVPLNDFPLLREWVSCTAYDDGSIRVPGYITLRNRGHSYEVTVYDVDEGLRLPVRGPDLDRTLMLVETLLGTQDAAWEVDDYLQSQLARKSARKKKAG